MRDSRKKISKTDTLIYWDIDGKTVKQSLDERLKEVRSQAQEKMREGDHIRSSGYSKKMDGTIQASARVEPKESLLIEDQISPENIVEYTTTEGETFDVEKLRKEMSRSSLLSSIIGLPLPVPNEFGRPSLIHKASPLDHQATRNFGSNSMGYIGNKPPDPIQLELLETQKAILHHLQNQERPKPEVHNHFSHTLPDASKEEEIQNHPPSPATRKTQVLDKMEDHYRACVKKNGKQRIGLKVFYKTKEVQDILKWGKKKLGFTVEPKTIADRMRTVNKDFGVNAKRGRPPTSVPKQKNKEPITKKLDLDKYDEEFLADDF